MFAITIDTDWFTQLDSTWWIVIAGLGVLWGSKLVPAGLWAKVTSWLPSKDDWPPSPLPDVVDDMPLLIHQMRLLACDDVPSVRDGINKHLDEIEQLISGTEIEPA